MNPLSSLPPRKKGTAGGGKKKRREMWGKDAEGTNPRKGTPLMHRGVGTKHFGVQRGSKKKFPKGETA